MGVQVAVMGYIFRDIRISCIRKGKGMTKYIRLVWTIIWKSKNGKNTLQTVLDYLKSDETKELNHHYLYQYPEKNEEDNKCSNTGTVSDLWKAEINYIFFLPSFSTLICVIHLVVGMVIIIVATPFQPGMFVEQEGWQKEEHVEAKQYITVYTIWMPAFTNISWIKSSA